MAKKKVKKDVLTPAQRAWVNALRSGGFKQGSGRLTHAGRHCCLGVACRVLQPLHEGSFMLCSPTSWKSELSLSANASWAKVDLNLRDDLGSFEGDAVHGLNNLAALNDTGKLSFTQIADLIESRPQDFFFKTKLND